MSALRMLPADAELGFSIPAASLNPVPESVGKAALATIADPFLRLALRQAGGIRPARQRGRFRAGQRHYGSLS
jgi:hypothetical protein